MKIIGIVGAITAEEDAAVREFLAAFAAGAYTPHHLARLPRRRVDVHVASNANDQPFAVIVIENGVFRFQLLDGDNERVS